MDWLFEADRDVERRFPGISILGVASIVSWIELVFRTTLVNIGRFPRELNVLHERVLSELWPVVSW